MNKFLSLALALVMVFGASFAMAGQTAVIDEWGQTVTVEGAKGAKAQAYQGARYGGDSLVGEVGNTEQLFNSVTKWTAIRDYRDVDNMSGSDYLNQ